MLQTRPAFGAMTRRPMAARPLNTPPPAAYRSFLVADEPGPLDPLARNAAVARIEAALFLADEPLTAKRLAEVAGLADATEARNTAERLRTLYEADQSAFTISDVAGGYLLLTRSAFHAWLVRLHRTGHEARLTPAALETLAVVAYKQPVMRAEVEAIRGVNCTELLNVLVEKGLIRVAGRHDSLGRPQLFGTTKKFLQTFGLNSLDELPAVDVLHAPTAVGPSHSLSSPM